MTPEHSLRAVGVAQSLESGLRCSVAVIFRLILGYTAGLPPTAISVNGALSLGLGLVLEVPAGTIGDAFGSARCCVLGYIAQALAAVSLFLAIRYGLADERLMWAGVLGEAIFDAAGNALLSGAREATYRTVVSSAYAESPAGERKTMEQQFLVLSERYGRLALLLVPLVLLSAMVLLRASGHEGWTIVAMAIGWLYLAVNIQTLVRGHAREEVAAAPSLSPIAAAREAMATIRSFARAQWGAALPFIALAFVFGVVHGFLIVAVLRQRQGSTWWQDRLWLPVVAVNMMFIVGRLSRSVILPRLVKRFGPRTTAVVGSLAIAALGAAIWAVPELTGPVGLAAFLLVLPVPFDIAHGAGTRPALGVLMHGLSERSTVSVLSMLSAVSALLSAALAVYLTATGEGVPSTAAIGIMTIIGGLVAAAGARMMNAQRQA